MSEVRMPTQKRGIEKRNKIIKAGFKIICDKGYYNITTNDIATEAGVSVGIIYQYFNDKREIFIEGIKNYAKSIMFPMADIKGIFDLSNLETLLNDMINHFLKSHSISKKAHQEIVSMEHIDEDIEKIFVDLELETTSNICNLLRKNGLNIPNLEEKIHISYNLIDNYCHEVIYHKHDNLDYKIMKENVIKMILSILK